MPNPLRLAYILFILLCTSSILQGQPDQTFTSLDKKQIIDSALCLLKDNYIFPARIEDVEAFLLQQLDQGIYDLIQNPEVFLDSLNQQIARITHDTHIKILADERRVKQIRLDEKNEDAGKEREFTPDFLKRLQYENFRMRKLERLDGNIGYFSFLNFPPLGPSKESLTSAMNFLKYSNALIFDLRDNGGGHAESMHYLLGYFLADSTQIATWRYRLKNEIVTTFITTDTSVIKIPEEIPLFILVSHNTSSAAEGFAYTLQQYGRAVIIGEQTQGEANPGRLFVINDHLCMMIPTVESTHPVSKKSFDGIGVIPDISIDRKNALTQALLEAYTILASQTNDQGYQLFCEWQLPLLRSELNPACLERSLIEQLIGDYEGERKVLYEEGGVIYVNSIGQKEKLSYIGNGVFQNDAKPHLRLAMPLLDEPVPYFDWTWEDGGEPQRIKRKEKSEE